MKIAEISAFANFSVGNIMRDIKNYIDNNSNDICKVFYARGNKIENKDYINFSSKLKIYLNAFFARLLDNDGFCFKNSTRKLIKELDKYQPDIIHIHCLHGYYFNSKLFFKYLITHPNIKVIWTMHDTWAFTGHCCFFNRIDCSKWKTGCNHCQLIKDYPQSLFLDHSQKNYALKKRIFNQLPVDQMKIVVPSKWLENLLSYSYIKKYEVKVIYNGINLKLFNNLNNTSFVFKSKIILGVASVWDDRKGIDFFLKLNEILESDWKIILIGQLGEEIKLPNDIVHINRTSNREELIKYYKNAAVLFNPTLDDNYPTVNLEAQACGCKVLTFKTGGSQETNCGNLYVAESKDMNIIYNQIKQIANSKLNDVDCEKLSSDRMAKEYYNYFKNN